MGQWSDKPAKNLLSCLQAAGFVFASLTYFVHKQPSYSFFKIDLKLIHIKKNKKQKRSQDFTSVPVVKSLRFPCRGHSFDPWLGIPHAVEEEKS